jgi:hypothetical protein
MEHYHCPSPEGSTLQEPSGNKATKEIQDLVSKMITIQLVGPKGDIEMIGKKAKMKTHLQARPYVVFQWLAVLQHVHPLYKDDPKLNLQDFCLFKGFISECNGAVMDNAIAITEQSALDADQISGDDIAQIWSHILSVAEADILNTSEDSNSGAPSQLNTSKMNISYSFVVNENHQANSIFENQHTSSGRTNVSNNTEPSSNASDTEDDNTLEKESFNTKAQEMLDLIVETAKVFNVKLPENRDKEKQKAKPR